MGWANLNYIICVFKVSHDDEMLRNHPKLERTMNGARFLGIDDFILTNFAGLILRYWRQNRQIL